MEIHWQQPRNSWSDGQSTSGNCWTTPPLKHHPPISCDKPTKAEIKKAIMTLRSGKAARPDQIPAEAIKADMEAVTNMLHSLFSKIWEKEEVPVQWKEGIVIKLPKKGDLTDCNNYWGIMLLSVPGKVLNRILLERMKEAVDPKLWDEQAGFRRNRSCADQITSLQIIVEQSLEWNFPFYINFIDYEKAFYSVDRETLWKLLRHYGVPEKIITLIHCTYQDLSCKIAHASQLSESFKVKTGVRQGCLLSPFLFLLVINWIMKTTTTGRNNGIQWTPLMQLDDLDFADDLVLLSHNHHRCRIRPLAWRPYQLGQDSRSARRKQSWWRLTPLPTHQSQLVESPSGKWIPSSTLGVQLTDRGAQTEMSQPGFARPEHLLSCSRTSGHPRRSGQEPNFASSTPVWSQSCSTDAKLGEWQRQCYRKSRHSSTPVCGASTTSDGQSWSQMKTCGSERDRNQ